MACQRSSARHRSAGAGAPHQISQRAAITIRIVGKRIRLRCSVLLQPQSRAACAACTVSARSSPAKRERAKSNCVPRAFPPELNQLFRPSPSPSVIRLARRCCLDLTRFSRLYRAAQNNLCTDFRAGTINLTRGRVPLPRIGTDTANTTAAVRTTAGFDGSLVQCACVARHCVAREPALICFRPRSNAKGGLRA
jgi:hypothetical protein